MDPHVKANLRIAESLGTQTASLINSLWVRAVCKALVFALAAEEL